jgi:adenosylcobyric acid synthase
LTGGAAKAAALMVQGTGSGVGKSLLVAGLCRALTRRGLAVRPFKPQNMSNNAAVTREGGEIGRAQALQARACRLPPATDMNPVLLKPQGETGAQLVVRGALRGTVAARDYHRLKPTLLPEALESFHRLAREADIVLVEGAGSPAEMNLREGDIANMGFAEAADLPVLLVGDVERGGVLAALVGTHALLPPAERARLKGYVVNKFRGDPRLFDGAIAIIGGRTGLPCLGVVPFLDAARLLPEEDSLGVGRGGGRGRVRVAVPLLPRIANFDDLDPLGAEPDIALDWVRPGEPLPADAALVILPGSKATLADLAAFRAAGWERDLAWHVRRGGRVLGLCGGYQMLGRRIVDPRGIEGPGEAAGLGLLEVETELTPAKILAEADGTELATGAAVRGYEMHVGETRGPGTARPMLRLADGRADGAVSSDGLVAGCYLHGIFASDGFRRRFVARLGGAPDPSLDFAAQIETALDALAAHLERHLDVDLLLAIARRQEKTSGTPAPLPIASAR